MCLNLILKCESVVEMRRKLQSSCYETNGPALREDNKVTHGLSNAHPEQRCDRDVTWPSWTPHNYPLNARVSH